MEKQEGDFVSKKVSYMIQAIQGALSDETVKSFGKFKEDDERFKFVWELKEVHDVITLEKEFEEKSEKLARIHREKGNEYFQKKSYLTALGEYNRSVIRAPLYVACSHLHGTDDKGVKGEHAENGTPDEGTGQVKDEVQQHQGEAPPSGTDESKPSDENKTQDQMKNELALAFANRSAALFHLKKYKECLEDIQLAIENDYPTESLYKIYDRQGSCYAELGNTEAAVVSLNLAKEALGKANVDEKVLKSWNKSIEKQLVRCRKLAAKEIQAESVKKVHADLPRITGGPDISHPNASALVRIQYNNVVGRHAVAANEIKVGDILMVDKPFAFVLYPQFHKTHCYHCFKRVMVPIPCVQCSSVIFCSRECRSESWESFHRFECEFFALLDTSACAKIGHLAIRLVMVAGLKDLLEHLRRRKLEKSVSSAEVVGIDCNGIFHSSYETVYDMNTHNHERTSDQLFDFSVVSCFLMKILQTSGYVTLAEDSDDFTLLGGVLLRHLQIIQCNANRIIELQQPSKFDETRPGELGIGLYPTVALINHSCDPSADLNFFNNTVVLRAIRNINPDEEITISYGPLFYEVKLGTRQMQLKGAYYFRCRCLACKEQWPILEEMFDDVPRYRCGNCRANLKIEDRFERKFYICSKCHYKQDMEDVVGQLQTSYDVFARAMNNAMSGGASDALPDFVQHLLLLQRYIVQPWRDFCACQSAVKQCYRLQANIRS